MRDFAVMYVPTKTRVCGETEYENMIRYSKRQLEEVITVSNDLILLGN